MIASICSSPTIGSTPVERTLGSRWIAEAVTNFVLWCELPAQVDSIELWKQARRAGISLAPGPLFSPDGGYRNFIRLNCGYPWSPLLERSIAILGHLARGLAG